MVFVDHMNFEIALRQLYQKKSELTPSLDYDALFRNVVKNRSGIDFIKAFIFAPKPDDFLMQDERLEGSYKWITQLGNKKYIDVIEGRYVARQIDESTQMDILNKKTYFKEEKGTDINFAVHMLSKGQYNSYDAAFAMSADTDYITVYRQLKNMGKIVIAVAVKDQNISKIIPEVDDYIILDEAFFNGCLRTKQTSLPLNNKKRKK